MFTRYDDVNQYLRFESESVSTTGPEKDFANLDHLSSEKSNAITIALEGMIVNFEKQKF